MRYITAFLLFFNCPCYNTSRVTMTATFGDVTKPLPVAMSQKITLRTKPIEKACVGDIRIMLVLDSPVEPHQANVVVECSGE